MKLLATSLACLMLISCGGRVAPSGIEDAQPTKVVSYTVGHCVKTGPCSKVSSPLCCGEGGPREGADTWTVLSDCTRVHSMTFTSGPLAPGPTETSKLSASACAWAKSSVTQDLVTAIDDPVSCADSAPGVEAMDAWTADGRQHHKELVRPCSQPALAWFRTGFGINCVYSK